MWMRIEDESSWTWYDDIAFMDTEEYEVTVCWMSIKTIRNIVSGAERFCKRKKKIQLNIKSKQISSHDTLMVEELYQCSFRMAKGVNLPGDKLILIFNFQYKLMKH